MATRQTSGRTATANAAPTKRLLVDVLTKDIDLIAAILDLVDNSVDGARRLTSNGDLNGYWVEVTFQGKSLTIRDNCGGISIADATERAFRFGPDDDDPPDPYTTGQFGVGMKRALFKLGTAFEVRSRAQADSFRVRENVDRWLKAPGWKFTLRDVEDDLDDEPALRGTSIVVKPVRPTIAKELGRDPVINRLKAQIGERHQVSIAKGLTIRVNRTALKSQAPEVVCDKRIVPVVDKRKWNGRGEPIDLRLVCGVFPGRAPDAGWSIFLNDRAVLLADKTAQTGWGDEERIPRFHNQYGRFRGFAFLTCEDTTRLPWNTTKTGLDEDDPVYARVRGLMIDAADPVIDFLDAVKNEPRDDDAYGELRRSVEKGKLKSIYRLAEGPKRRWKAPKPGFAPPEPPDTTRVYTDQPFDRVEAAKDAAGPRVSSNKDLGEFIFEYFFEREVR